VPSSVEHGVGQKPLQLRVLILELPQPLSVTPATASRILRRAGLSRMRDLNPVEPVARYERTHPGGMIRSTSRKSAASPSPK
jgi:hypothetical protein